MVLVFSALSANASTFTTARITNDATVDVEPTVVRQTAAGYTATIMGYIGHPNGPTQAPRNYYVSRGDNGQTFSGLLGLPAGQNWTYSADPYLAPNQTPNANHPVRTYMVGTLGNLSVISGAPTGIAVWNSDNAGQTWSVPTVIASTPATSPNTTDKPHIGVSQHSSSYGYVYVAYMQRYRDVNNVTRYSIRVARSTDGDNWYGPAFGEDVELVNSTSYLNCAQVVVGPANGYIYVTWADYGANRIMLARSPSPGTISGAWTLDSTGPTGNFFSTTNLNGSVRAITVPITRYNWKTNKIIVVWHEREAAGSNQADVYIAAKGTAGWQAKQRISNEALCAPGSTADQWRPAVDFRSNGELYVTYYDRQRDCANDALYDLYFVRLGNGNPFTVLEGPSRVSTFQSTLPLNSNAVGEYHELWCDATICYSAWIGIDTQGDLFLTTIQ
jgi:hypothetical protein